jgi:hypothetical protein
MLVLPDCPATNALRTKFPGLEGAAAIENWVDQVVGDEDRIQCFGVTAAARARRKLEVMHRSHDQMLGEGELRLDGDRWIAYIPDSQPRRRARFALAHELGHAALYAVDPKLDQCGPGVERICNLFAAELLMPEKLVEHIWCTWPDAEAIWRLAWKTASSLSASCIRLAEHVGTITTGLASADGLITERYGAKLDGVLRGSVSVVSRSAHKGKASVQILRELTVSIRASDGRIAFVVQRMGQAARTVQLPAETHDMC